MDEEMEKWIVLIAGADQIEFADDEAKIQRDPTGHVTVVGRSDGSILWREDPGRRVTAIRTVDRKRS